MDNAKRVTLVDVNALLADLKGGRIPGLSGIHPNSKGYRQVAGLFLESINEALHRKYRLPACETCESSAQR